MNLVERIGLVVGDSVLTCIFGSKSISKKLLFEKDDGSMVEYSIPYYIKTMLVQLLNKNSSRLRVLIGNNDTFIGSKEKRILRNIETYRSYVKQLIKERREEMTQKDFD
jgi:hypothetical protein